MNGNKVLGVCQTLVFSSHSLGTLIEWKHLKLLLHVLTGILTSSHSLGTLIEWKPDGTITVEQYRALASAGVVFVEVFPLAGDIN